MATQEEIEAEPLDGGADDDEILEIAHRRFLLAEEAEIQQRIDAIDDLNFLAGNQWPDEIKREREVDGRPCITINRMPGFVSQITNDQRQNRPSMKVSPADDKADIDTAKVLQGLLRSIESKSKADEAYDTAFEGSAAKGLGYFRIVTQYANPKSFNQEIRIKRIRNSFTVYPDPNYQECDGSDMNWCFVFENMPIEDFKDQFKESKISSADQLTALGDQPAGWITKSTVRVAEYFYKTFKTVDIFLLSDGSVVETDALAQAKAQGLTVKDKRKTTLPAIKWCKFSSCEILDSKDWAGQWIPIVPVVGTEYDIDGKRILQGIIRNAKDPQRMYNYWNTNATETIALAPKAPFIGAAGQFEGFENSWEQSNQKNFPYLEYNPVDLNGQLAPPPQRNVVEPPIGAITQVMMHSADDMKATTGLFDPSLGDNKGDHSGIAIQKLNTQAQTGNFHFVDNLSRSIRHGGRICLDLIPFVYNEPQAVQILGDDGKAEQVLINQMFQDRATNTQKIHDFSKGGYECTVGTGPSYATKRQEASATMLELARAYPKLLELAGDIMIGNMDWAAADEVAERIKASMPPGLVHDKNGPPPIPPQLKQMLDQLKQQNQQLTQHLNASQDEHDQKTRELASKERIAEMQCKVQLELGLAKLQAASATTMLQHEIDRINQRMAMIGENDPLETGIDPAAGPSPGAQPDPNQQPTGGQPPGNQSMGA